MAETDGIGRPNSASSPEGALPHQRGSPVHPMHISPTRPIQQVMSRNHTPPSTMNDNRMEEREELDAPLDFSMKKSDDSKSMEPMPHLSPISNSSDRSSPTRDSRPIVNGAASPVDKPAGIARSEQKIGEPQTATAGTLPGTLLPGLASMGALPGISAAMMQNNALLGALPQFLDATRFATPLANNVNNDGTNGKNCRPFKAYPKDPLSMPLGYLATLPGMMQFPSVDSATLSQAMGMNSDDIIKQYKQFMLNPPRTPNNHSQPLSGETSPKLDSSDCSSDTTSPPNLGSYSGVPRLSFNGVEGTEGGMLVPTNLARADLTSPSAHHISGSLPGHSPGSGSKMSRKRGRILPEEQKDTAYWERRRKNNEAAKRSRDARRAKEDEIAIRAALLEQENLKLRVEVAALKNETAKLRCMLYNS